MITGIVESEGPILDEMLARRIARLHGWQRTGNKITQRVTMIASKTCKKSREAAGGTFYWPTDLEAEQAIPFRTGLDRTVDEISMQELVSLALDVLAAGKIGEDAISAMAKAVGLHRLRASSRPRLELAIRLGQQKIGG